MTKSYIKHFKAMILKNSFMGWGIDCFYKLMLQGFMSPYKYKTEQIQLFMRGKVKFAK